MEFIVYSEGYVPEQQFGDMIVSVLILKESWREILRPSLGFMLGFHCLRSLFIVFLNEKGKTAHSTVILRKKASLQNQTRIIWLFGTKWCYNDLLTCMFNFFASLLHLNKQMAWLWLNRLSYMLMSLYGKVGTVASIFFTVLPRRLRTRCFTNVM